MNWLIRALLVTVNNHSRSWWAIHRWTDWSGPYLSRSTIDQDLDHPYTDVLTDQDLTCYYQQSINILISQTQDVLTDQGLTCHYQQSIKILIIHTQMFWLIRALSLSTINQDLDHPYTDVLTDQGLTCHYQQSIKILISHTQMFWLIRVLLVTINNQWRSWSAIHRCSDWSGSYLPLSTTNEDLDHQYTDVLTDQGLTCHYQQSIKILISHTLMFWLIRVLLVTINSQSNQDLDHPYTDGLTDQGLFLSLSTINQDLDKSYTDILTDQGLTCHYQQSIKILIIHTQMDWLIRALLVIINNQSRSW